MLNTLDDTFLVCQEKLLPYVHRVSDLADIQVVMRLHIACVAPSHLSRLDWERERRCAVMKFNGARQVLQPYMRFLAAAESSIAYHLPETTAEFEQVKWGCRRAMGLAAVDDHTTESLRRT